MYGLHSTDIIAYVFNTEVFHPGCIGEMFGDNVGSDFVEGMLDNVAGVRGIDRAGPFDSSEFPSPVFADDSETLADMCGRCHRPIDD